MKNIKNRRDKVVLNYCTLFVFILLFQFNNTKVHAFDIKLKNDKTSIASNEAIKTIKGTVTDQNGNPLPGATITVKGENQGTTSDFDGNYTLSFSNEVTTIVASYLGYTTKEVIINGRTVINIQLLEKENALDEVVVVGYGTTRKRDLTGAVTSVNLENSPISVAPNINPLQALQGTTPGLNIGQVTSAGSTPGILIRGQNSLTGGNSPLIVVDNVVFRGNLNEIPSGSIATIDILKDASAASIYGARSANGVIIVTTKRGKSSKPVISFDSYIGFQDWTTKPDLRTGKDFIDWRRDNLRLRGTEDLSLENILSETELQAYNEGHQLNWLDEVTQSGAIQNYQLSVSGRTDNTNYYISGTYLNQEGILKNDSYENFSVIAKLENDVTDWLTFGANIYYAEKDFSGIAPSMYFATYMSPYSYKYVPGFENQLHRYPQGSTSLLNPFWGNPNVGDIRLADDLNKTHNFRMIGFMSVDIPFIEGLNFRVNATKNRNTSERASFAHENAFINTLNEDDILNPSKFLGSARGSKRIGTSESWVMDNLLNYKRQFGNHNVDALLGYTREYSKYESVSFSGRDFRNAGTTVLGFNGLSFGDSEKRGGSTGFSEESIIGYLGRLNYNYNSKYYLTLNFRRDGYSAFAPDNKFGDFYGGSVAWTISEEDFIKDNIEAIDYLKFRVSYGQNGNLGIPRYSSYASVGTGTTIFGTTPFIYSYPRSLANKSLSWETTTALNFGVDFDLFDGILSGNIDIYKSKTEDQLLTRGLPPITGYTSIRTNIGQVDNKGIEITLNSVNINTSNFKWESGLKFWRNRSKLVSLYGLDNDGDGIEDDDVGNRWFIGEELGVVYDYTVDGVVQNEDTEYTTQFGINPGEMKIRDIDGRDADGNLTGVPDGKINSADRSIIGYRTPNFNMNLSNTITYKDFQLYFDINFISGGKNRYLGNNKTGLNPAALLPTAATWLNEQYWTPEVQSTRFPAPNNTNSFGYGFYQSREFARLQNVTLSYQLPKKITDLLKINSLKIYASGKNLFTKSDWIGLDPETGGTIGGSNPALRIITAGLNLKF